MKIAAPSAASTYVKWTSTELLTLIAGMIKDQDGLQAHSAFIQLLFFFVTLNLSICITMNSYLSMCIG